MKSTVIWVIMPSGLVKSTDVLQECTTSILWIKDYFRQETGRWTIWHYNLKDHILHSYPCENLKSSRCTDDHDGTWYPTPSCFTLGNKSKTTDQTKVQNC
jgi:hypothetical protein